MDLNFSGNLLVLTWYSDGDLYDLSVCEQISIGTRTLVSLDKNSLGSRFDSTWKRYDYVYNNGQYVASLGNNVYHVIELSGKSYLLYDVNVTSSAELAYNLALFSRVNPYDVVRLNLVNGVGYNLNAIVWEDHEWGYTSKFSYGQLVINGNGAQIVGNLDINFMYVGSDANVVLNNVTVRFFNHVFMNHGDLLCKDSILG